MNTRAANRYAKAMIELALQSKTEEQLYQDIQHIAEALTHSEALQNVLQSPIIKTSDKRKALEAVFGNQVQPFTNKVFDLLAQNNRMDLLYAVTQQFSRLYHNQKGIVKAVVTTAVALDENTKQKVMEKAKQMAGNKQIMLESKINPDIIGGFILRVDDVQIDASIFNRLSKLKQTLTA